MAGTLSEGRLALSSVLMVGCLEQPGAGGGRRHAGDVMGDWIEEAEN